MKTLELFMIDHRSYMYNLITALKLNPENRNQA